MSLPSLRSRHNIPPNFYSDERVLTTTSRHNFPPREIDEYNKNALHIHYYKFPSSALWLFESKGNEGESPKCPVMLPFPSTLNLKSQCSSSKLWNCNGL
jgi:hypothetical protein